MATTRKFILPIAALIFFTILFCLPGSAFPKDDWLSKISFDKFVHIGIFTVLLFLWTRALQAYSLASYIIFIIVAVLYGLLIEFVQDRLVTNRSWDMGDVVADFAGSIIGVVAWNWYKKNKPL